MSATTTAALHIKVYPPPPTSNALDPKQRSRLLRSARKLEALLGETPILLEAETEDPTTAAEPTPQPISSSSWDTSSYVHVPSNVPSAPYQVQAILNDHSPSSSRSSSPSPASHQQQQHKRQKQMPPVPGDRDLLASSKPKGSSHPLLLRLRSNTAGADKTSSRAGNPHAVLNFTIPPIPPFSPVASSFNQNHDALSPSSSPAVGVSGDAALPPSPSSAIFSFTAPHGGLSDREKRRKMAKLARTLGENIPPELVFHGNKDNNATSNKDDNHRSGGAGTGVLNPVIQHLQRKASSASLSRSTSLGIRGTRGNGGSTGVNGHKLTKSIGGGAAAARSMAMTNMGGPLPILPVAETPVSPASPFTRTNSPSPSTSATTPKRKRTLIRPNAPTTPETEGPPPTTTTTTSSPTARTPTPRRHRPRSLTLGSLSAFASPALIAASKSDDVDTASNHSGDPATTTASSPSASKSSRLFGFARSRGANSLDSPRDMMPPLVNAPPPPPPPVPVPVLVHPSMRKDQPFALVFDPSPSRDSSESVDRDEISADDSHAQVNGSGRAHAQGYLDANEWDGRRKEREWSGEWNVKDMERVARALRELRGR